jgi:hypothetical protein
VKGSSGEGSALIPERWQECPVDRYRPSTAPDGGWDDSPDLTHIRVCGRLSAMLSAPSVLSQEPPTQDLVDWANLTLVVSSAELFFTSIALFVAAAWGHGTLPHQFAETGAVILGLSMCCLFVAAVLDQGGYEAAENAGTATG